MTSRKYRITTTKTDVVMGRGYCYASDSVHLFEATRQLGSLLVKVEQHVTKHSIMGAYKEWVPMSEEDLKGLDLAQKYKDVAVTVQTAPFGQVVYGADADGSQWLCRKDMKVYSKYAISHSCRHLFSDTDTFVKVMD